MENDYDKNRVLHTPGGAMYQNLKDIKGIIATLRTMDIVIGALSNRLTIVEANLERIIRGAYPGGDNNELNKPITPTKGNS